MSISKTGVGKPGAAKKIVEDKLAPATDMAASGALIEPTIVDRIDTEHPAVDNEPRKGATVDMNRIDFNTPSALQSQEDAVVEQLTGDDAA